MHHILFFLALAAERGLAITFDGERQPDAGEVAAIHHEAHARCYIANSLNAEIVILERC